MRTPRRKSVAAMERMRKFVGECNVLKWLMEIMIPRFPKTVIVMQTVRKMYIPRRATRGLSVGQKNETFSNCKQTELVNVLSMPNVLL